MDTFILAALALLGALAVIDLFVGVSNDAVNFLNSAVGSRTAPFWVIMTVASLGVLLGATFSSGMMEVARTGVLVPEHFTFKEVIIVFTAVMVCDVLLLNTFNSLGLPTSTTVSIVFELFGGATALACYKVWSSGAPIADLGLYLNSAKALAMIMAILVSVVVAFFAGLFVQYLLRLIFSFNYERYYKLFGGIYGGVFTPTEAAAVSVVYGLVVGVFIYREVKMKDMIDILVDSGKTTGGIMLIIGAATLFSYVCTVFGIAQAAQALLLEISGNKYIFLLIVNVIFLIAGCFVDANSAMYIFIPIMYPVATQLGIDPVHFGVIATVNLAIGQVTPPVGVNLFVAIGVSEKLQGLRDKTKVTIVSMSKAVWPQIVACIIALLLITYVPWFSTVLLFGK